MINYMGEDNQVAQEPLQQEARLVGQVKWFNTKAGYGFITVLDDTNRDVFVHHSSILTTNEQYKYLVQGEYVTLSLTTSSKDNKILAANVKGIKEGLLMCEVRTNSSKR